MRFREPLIVPFASVAAGSVTAFFSPVPLAAALTAGILTGILIFAAQRYAPHLLWPCIAVTMAFAGMALPALHPAKSPPMLSVPDNVPAILEGCVVDPALVAADRERFTLELATGARAAVSLYSKPGEDFPELPYGSRIELTGKVRTPHNYNNPGSFDMVHYLARQHIYWNISADAATVRRLPGHCGTAAAHAIYTIRTACLDRLDRLYAGDPYANGMMQAILIGATAKLDRAWTLDYRSTGTFHALVISGGHVAVLAAVLLFFLRIAAAPNWLALLTTIGAAWLYAGVTGWQAPVLRSAAGMTLFGIGRWFYREGRLLNTLAAVALFFVAADPEELFDASFQLSFLAVALIGAFVVPALDRTSGPLARGARQLPDIRRDLRLEPRAAQFRVEMRLLARTLHLALRIPEGFALRLLSAAARVLLFLWEIFVTSLFIQIGLTLPMVVYFHRASISGLSANAIVVPLLSAIVPLGFAAIAFQSHSLAGLCAWLLDISRRAVGFHARWEPDWRIPSPPVWLAALFTAALIAAAWRTAHRRIRIAAWVAALAALAAIAIHPFAPAIGHGTYELDAIDVGQGDSLLNVFPDGRIMLIDAGGIPSFGRTRKPGIDIGEDVVSPYLWSRSIQHLDVVAMTHAHEDHAGGMSAVLRNFRPKELWAGATQESPEWIGVRETARELGIPIRHLELGKPFPFGGATVQVLAPLPDYAPGDQPSNNDSLVLWIRYRSNSFLLTGDMEKGTEEQLFYGGLLPRADVLKVGHHGSRTSSTPDLLDAVHPAFGIVSDGFENAYGHPHPLTLRALSDRHIATYRTDERGLIRVLSDGSRIRVE
ncbi:MAG: ComEC/Rec2 family competence protein [Acidobacteriota bacterium]|nr:ComEC/Rec2 family competence protein [Acidobacteriota bacterium]